jgi:hypothetical protein
MFEANLLIVSTQLPVHVAVMCLLQLHLLTVQFLLFLFPSCPFVLTSPHAMDSLHPPTPPVTISTYYLIHGVKWDLMRPAVVLDETLLALIELTSRLIPRTCYMTGISVSSTLL